MKNLSIRKMNELSKKKKKGFTLVELIIVIAVIAILAAVAIPKFGAVRTDANLSADRANAKIIATAVTTAVANGEITGTATATDVSSNANMLKYIDGNKLPTVKSGTGNFYVTYSTGDGVVVEIGSSTGTTVYPIS